jgi:CheY-like chemotaxis protein
MAQIGLLEDNVRIARLCATMLQYAGHQVIVYHHARECLHALLPPKVYASNKPHSHTPLPAQNLPVDILILDLHLPDITGLDVIYHLNSDPQTCTLPLIFCTAATPSEIAKALSMAPRASFIEKPFTFHDLTDTITNVLANLR